MQTHEILTPLFLPTGTKNRNLTVCRIIDTFQSTLPIDVSTNFDKSFNIDIIKVPLLKWLFVKSTIDGKTSLVNLKRSSEWLLTIFYLIWTNENKVNRLLLYVFLSIE